MGGDFSGLSGHTNELLLRHLIADRTDGRTDGHARDLKITLYNIDIFGFTERARGKPSGEQIGNNCRLY